MVRFFFRVLAFLLFAAACLFAVLDATRTIGAGFFVATPLVDTWTQISAHGPEIAAEWLSTNLHPALADPVLAFFLKWPTWLILSALALLAAYPAYKKRRRFRFASE